MKTFSRTVRIGMAAALLLASLTATGAQGYGPNGGSSFGREGRGLMQFRGKVVCAGCSLEEAHVAQPDEQQLYQLIHERGQVVMQAGAISNAPSWNTHSWPSQLSVRAADRVFAQLMAEENLFKEVEISGILYNSGTLDVFEVTIHG